jgi:hypothetical protein
MSRGNLRHPAKTESLGRQTLAPDVSPGREPENDPSPFRDGTGPSPQSPDATIEFFATLTAEI